MVSSPDSEHPQCSRSNQSTQYTNRRQPQQWNLKAWFWYPTKRKKKVTWYPENVRYCGEDQKAEQVCIDPKKK